MLPSLQVRRSARQQILMKILSLREREVLNQLKKILAIVASVRLTGATVVGGVNVTEFRQRRTWPQSFLQLLSWINGSCNSTVIDYSSWQPNDLL